MAEPSYDIEPGYEFQEEFDVERDHMGEGALKVAVATMLILFLVIIGVVQWTRMEGQSALVANTIVEPPPALRTARAEATKKLARYEVLDAENKIYQIPIERAMALEASEHADQ